MGRNTRRNTQFLLGVMLSVLVIVAAIGLGLLLGVVFAF